MGDLARVRRQAARTSLVTTGNLFLKEIWKSKMSIGGGCKILCEPGQVKKVAFRPHITAQHKQKCLNWAKRYLSCHLSKVLRTD